MGHALDVIQKLESQAEAMYNRTANGDGERMKKRIKFVESALDRAYDTLAEMGGGMDEAE